MLMEFVEGVTLDQKLKDGPLPVAEAVDYIMQVLSALEYAHARGVVHRDIKPANMMLTPGGVVKLMDFGIARSSADHKLTQTGTTVGSLYYMSPEQIQGVTTPDARSDLYSVGVSLYELVTGKRPFDGDSQFAIMSAHLQGTPVPPVTVDPQLPQMLNDVILMSVAKDAGCALSDRRGIAQRAFQRGVRTEAGGSRLPVQCAGSNHACRAAPSAARNSATGKPSRTMDGAGRGGRRARPRGRHRIRSLEREARRPRQASTPPAQTTAPAQPVADSPPATCRAASVGPQRGQPPPSATALPAAPSAAARVRRTPLQRARGCRREGGVRSTAATQQPAARNRRFRKQPVPQARAAAARRSRQDPAARNCRRCARASAQVGVRATGIRTSLQSLQRSQAPAA